MKLSSRIRDLVRAGLTRSSRGSRFGSTKSPARLEAQLEQIRKSLAQAAVREKQLQDELALAEEESRERDAIRLRRQLADLARSTDELQAALDLIEARVEMEQEQERKGEAELRPSEKASLVAQETESPQTTVADSGSDLAARKARLEAPPKRDD
jgi:septal ring factor EnvC (AmiA/AmiB activator)